MANEFVIREGFNSESNVVVSGSLIVSNVTGSLVSASYAISSSYSINSNTSSFIQSILTSSYAVTALSSSRSGVSNKTLNNSASLYAQTGVSSSSWTTLSGNNGYISSNFFHTNGAYGSLANSIQRGTYSSSIYLTPIYINRTGILSRFAVMCNLAVAGTAPGNIRAAVYTNSNTMLPKSKLFEFESKINLPASINRTFYEVTTSSGPTLQQGQIYWLAASVEDNVSNFNYTYLTDNIAVINLPSSNRIFNPILGSSIPIIENAVRNIGHYRYNLSSTGSALPNELVQDTSLYIASSYSTNNGGNFGTVHIGPFIRLIY